MCACLSVFPPAYILGRNSSLVWPAVPDERTAKIPWFTWGVSLWCTKVLFCEADFGAVLLGILKWDISPQWRKFYSLKTKILLSNSLMLGPTELAPPKGAILAILTWSCCRINCPRAISSSLTTGWQQQLLFLEDDFDLFLYNLVSVFLRNMVQQWSNQWVLDGTVYCLPSGQLFCV